MYCSRCMLLTPDSSPCPQCGKSDKLRAPQDDDMCFLLEEDAMFGDMLADVFRQNDVSFAYKQPREGWMSSIFGASFDKHRFYVAYSDLDKARALAASLFASDPVDEDGEIRP